MTLFTRPFFTRSPHSRLRSIVDQRDTRWVAIAAIALGILLRLLVALRNPNYDFDSFRIVADIVERGGNVYAETHRYNYGPIWLLIIRALDLLTGRNEVVFRYLLTVLLSLVDVGIFALLWQRFGKLAACLFLLNPISIIITGYHSQFDNLAIFLGMLALVAIDDDFENGLTWRKLAGLLLFGLSLITKHILFLFPLWLAVKQKGWWQKLAVLFVPILVFFVGFLPYVTEGRQGIIQNVLLYQSYDQQYFYRLFVPGALQLFLSSRTVWIGLLFLSAFFVRKLDGLRSLLIYTAVLVAASPAIANQYLSIPVAYVSVYFNPFTALYTLVGTWLLLVDRHGLHLKPLQVIPNGRGSLYAIMVALLTSGIVWMIWHEQIMVLARAVINEIRIQFPGRDSSD